MLSTIAISTAPLPVPFPPAPIAPISVSPVPPKYVPVAIDYGQQPWCDIYLVDGNKIRVQLMISSVYRIDGEKTPDGLPRYDLHAGVNVQAFPREEKQNGQGS